MHEIEREIDSYIKRTIVNAVKDFKKFEVRKSKREVAFDDIVDNISTSEIASLSVMDNCAIFSLNLEDIVEDEKLYKIIQELPDEEKEILTLSILKEWSSKEIAKKISKSDSRVRHIINNTILKIRKKYNEK